MKFIFHFLLFIFHLMFTESQLNAFNDAHFDSAEYASLFLKWADHKKACAEIGVVGVGCYRT